MKFVTRPIRVILALLLIAFVAAGLKPVTVKAEVEARITDTIDLTGIMRNSEGDRIMLNKYVTRAEFAQMLVQSTMSKGSMKETKTTRLFQDVKLNNTGAAFIQAAVTKGYMSGYLKGKFKPNQAVTLKEAAYGTLAVLGYSASDFSNQLSGSRLDKFKELGLDKNINRAETDKLTRTDCENLFYNLLNAKAKSGEIYAVSLGYSVDSDNKIDYLSLLEKTTKGPILAMGDWKRHLSKDVQSYNIYRGNSKIIAESIKDYSVLYYAEKTNKMWVYDNKIFGSLEDITYNNGKPQAIMVEGKSYAIEKPEDIRTAMEQEGIKKGSMVTVLIGRDDRVAYILPMQSRLAGGDWRSILGFDADQGTIYKNGMILSSAEVKSTDVIYYVKELKTVWVYSKTVYGVLSTITPSVALPEKVIVAGDSYSLDGVPVSSYTSSVKGLNDMTENTWGRRLRENAIQEGDNVMLSFGYDGKVVEISKVNKMSVTLGGYVLDVTDKLVKNEYKENSVKKVIRVVETGGSVLDLECNDSTITKGNIVEIRFVNGRTDIVKIEPSSVNSITDLSLRKFAVDARIIEVKDLNYVKLTVARAKDIKWGNGNALYAKVNSAGDITDLVLYNVTDSFYQYGLLMNVAFPNYESGIYGYRLTLVMDEELTLSSSDISYDINPGPKALRFEGDSLKEMKTLQQVRLKYISGKQANNGETVYQIADDVLVFYYQSGEYFKGTFDSLPIGGSYNIDGYMENGKGPIHIIIVTK